MALSMPWCWRAMFQARDVVCVAKRPDMIEGAGSYVTVSSSNAGCQHASSKVP
jgi:hypothetical protein